MVDRVEINMNDAEDVVGGALCWGGDRRNFNHAYGRWTCLEIIFCDVFCIYTEGTDENVICPLLY